MTKKHYESLDPRFQAVISKRAEMHNYLSKYISISSFCRIYHFSPNTYYLILHKKYISEDTWNKFIEACIDVIEMVDYMDFMVPYQKLVFIAYSNSSI